MIYEKTPKQNAEILAAAADSVAVAIGARVKNPHPLAVGLNLKTIAQTCALATQPRREWETEMSVMGRGMSTDLFGKTLAAGARQLALQTYDAQAAEHLTFTVPFDVKNFNPVEIVAADAQGVALELLGENAEVATGVAILDAGNATEVRLHTFAKNVGVSRRDVVNDDLQLFSAFVAGLGGSAARLEAELVAKALEGNPLMDDGAQAFAEAHNNVEAVALDAEALGRAMAKLRNQRTPGGQLAGLRARFLVVAPDVEFLARQLLKDSGLADVVVVAVLSNLPEGRWYLLADPLACPVVAVLRLAGSTSRILVEPHKMPIHTDSAGVRVRCDTGAALVRRQGIVRGGTA